MTDDFIKRESSFTTALARSLMPALFIALNIFLFAPATIFRGNTGEFSTAFADIISLFALPFVITVTAGTLLGLIVSRKFKHLWPSLLFAIGLLLWLEGFILVWDYGLHDGTGIEWSLYGTGAIIDSLIWLVVLLLAILFRKRVAQIAVFASIVLILLQGALLGSTYLSSPQSYIPKFTDKGRFDESLLEYSSKFNIIHLVLDGFQSDIFEEVVKEEGLEGELDGFTFFRENMTTAGSTALAVPAIFSGAPYIKGDKGSYISESFTKKAFTNDLFEAGFRVNLVPINTIPQVKATNYYMIPNPYGATLEAKKTAQAGYMADLSLFRVLPHYLKKWIYNGQNWRFKSRFSTMSDSDLNRPKLGYHSHKEFFKDYMDNIRLSGKGPAYHFIHLGPPHPPFVTGKDCLYANEILPPTRDNYKNECRCALKLVTGFIKRLKQLGLYDSSLIVLQADHGQGFSVMPTGSTYTAESKKGETLAKRVGRSMALLAIKGASETGPMQVSNKKSSIIDIKPTILAKTGLEAPQAMQGLNLFDKTPPTERKRYYGNYIITGSLFEFSSWKTAVKRKKEAVKVPPYSFGQSIRFGFLGNAGPYQKRGFAHGEDGFTWIYGESAELLIPLASTELASDLVTLEATFRPSIIPGKLDRQRVLVYIDNTQIDRWLVTNQGMHKMQVALPKRLFLNKKDITITLETPDATSPKSLGVSNDTRRLSIALFELKLF